MALDFHEETYLKKFLLSKIAREAQVVAILKMK